MRRPRQPLAPLDLQLYRLASFLGPLALVSTVAVTFLMDRLLVTALVLANIAECILYLLGTALHYLQAV